MEKRARLISALLIGCMLILSACSGNGKNEEKVIPSNGSAEKLTELTVAFPIFGTIPKDMSLIQDAVNEITRKKINATVKFLPIGISDWQQQMNLKFSSSEKLDLMAVLGTYTSMVSRDQLLPLDQLLKEQGQGITKALDPAYLDAAKVKGTMYAVPTLRDMATSYGIAMRKDLVDKYNIDVNQINTLADVEGVLKTIKAGEPDIAPLIPGTVGASILTNYQTYDNLIDRYGVLPNYDNDLKLVNLYETEEYAEQLKMVRNWYESGLILKDASTNKNFASALIKSNRAFAYLLNIQPMSYSGESQSAGIPMVVRPLLRAASTTATITNTMWAIPVTSAAPAKAMEFLNLMYTDKELVNMLDWGIEGKHYVVKSDNIIDYPPGVDAQSSGYNLNMGWLFGNEFLAYVWNGQDPKLWEKVAEFNKSALKSKALGFSFDPTPVKSEFATVGNVIGQYYLPLETGSVDPEEILTQFIAKLKTAGIDKVIAEKQKQLDEWAKTNK